MVSSTSASTYLKNTTDFNRTNGRNVGVSEKRMLRMLRLLLHHLTTRPRGRRKYRTCGMLVHLTTATKVDILVLVTGIPEHWLITHLTVYITIPKMGCA